MRGSVGAPQSLNRYAYSLSDPINLVDPYGLDPVVRPRRSDYINPQWGYSIFDAIRLGLPWGDSPGGLWFHVTPDLAFAQWQASARVREVFSTIWDDFFGLELASWTPPSSPWGQFLAGYFFALSLLKDAECRRYIKGASSEDPSKLAETLRLNGQFILRPKATEPGGAVAQQQGNGTDSTITLFAPFFDPGVGTWARRTNDAPGLSAEEARAMLILHEIRHATTGIGHPTPTNPAVVPGRTELDEQFNNNIIRDCLKKPLPEGARI
jgi:hypothetical protein